MTVPATSRPWPLSVGPGRLLVAVAVTAVGVGAAAVVADWRLLVPLGLGLPLVLAVVAEHLGGAQPTPGRAGPVPRLAEVARPAGRAVPTGVLHSPAWLAAVWAALFFGTSLRLLSGQRDVAEAASGSVSLDNAIELGITGLAAMTLASALRRGWPGRIPPIAWLFLAFALLGAASVTWSVLPIFSAGRAFQFVVLAGLVAYTAARVATEPGLGDRLLVPIMRYLALGVLATGALGVAEGGLDMERFTWRGTHPNAAASMMLIPCIALAFHPRRARVLGPVPWWIVPVLLLPLVYATGSRANVAGGLVAVVCAWFVAATRSSRVGAFGVGTGLIGIAVASAFAADRVVEWFMRDQTAEDVTGLNGRLELWEYALAHPAGSQVRGVGIGAARGALPLHWNPTNVHSAWIDLLQTLGVLGLALMGAVVVSLLVMVVLRRLVTAAWMAVFVTVASVNSITIAQPGYALVLLCLALVVASDLGPDVPPRRAATRHAGASQAPATRTG